MADQWRSPRHPPPRRRLSSRRNRSRPAQIHRPQDWAERWLGPFRIPHSATRILQSLERQLGLPVRRGESGLMAEVKVAQQRMELVKPAEQVGEQLVQ